MLTTHRPYCDSYAYEKLITICISSSIRSMLQKRKHKQLRLSEKKKNLMKLNHSGKKGMENAYHPYSCNTFYNINIFILCSIYYLQNIYFQTTPLPCISLVLIRYRWVLKIQIIWVGMSLIKIVIPEKNILQLLINISEVLSAQLGLLYQISQCEGNKSTLKLNRWGRILHRKKHWPCNFNQCVTKQTSPCIHIIEIEGQ